LFQKPPSQGNARLLLRTKKGGRVKLFVITDNNRVNDSEKGYAMEGIKMTCRIADHFS
jgi:hypothetical protein